MPLVKPNIALYYVLFNVISFIKIYIGIFTTNLFLFFFCANDLIKMAKIVLGMCEAFKKRCMSVDRCLGKQRIYQFSVINSVN